MLKSGKRITDKTRMDWLSNPHLISFYATLGGWMFRRTMGKDVHVEIKGPDSLRRAIDQAIMEKL